MNFKEDKVCDFVNKLASDSPVPGGGGSAALTAALSAALSSMVFNLTIGKKAYEAMDEEIKSKVRLSLSLCEKKIQDFQVFMARDAEAFSGLMEAYKLPKDSEENISIRESRIQKGLNNSMMVPYTLANEIFDLFSAVEVAAMYGNKNVLSDAGVSAILAHAAVESSILNVRVNLKFITGSTGDIAKKCDMLLQESKAKKDKLLEMVYSKL